MTKRKGPDDGSTGQHDPESPQSQSSPTSPPKKTKQGKSKVLTIPVQLADGSAESTTKSKTNRLSVSANESGSPAMRKVGQALKLQDKRDREADALRRIGVSEEQVKKYPPVTELIREARSGKKLALKAMRFCSEDSVRAFLSRYDSIPEGDRAVLPWEAILIAENINANEFTGAVAFALKSYSVNAVSMIALSAHPKVMKASVDAALLTSGERDRTNIHMALGFLPSPKGPTFIGKAVFGGEDRGGPSAPPTVEAETVSTPPAEFNYEGNINYLFPSATDVQEKIVAVKQKALASETK